MNTPPENTCERVRRREFCDECEYPMSEALYLVQTVPHGPWKPELDLKFARRCRALAVYIKIAGIVGILEGEWDGGQDVQIIDAIEEALREETGDAEGRG